MSKDDKGHDRLDFIESVSRFDGQRSQWIKLSAIRGTKGGEGYQSGVRYLWRFNSFSS